MRRLRTMLLLCVLLLAWSACTADTPKSAEEEWLERAQLDAKETAEELYEAALAEDTLVVYTDTSRMFEVKVLFERAYPGLTVTVHDVRATDIIKTLRLPADQREAQYDIICCSDLNAILSGELAPQGVVYKYVPYDIVPMMKPEHNETLLEFVGEGAQLFYHSALAASPVTNWWELTEPRFRGKVFMIDPARSHTSSALLCAMIANSDEMAAAYEALYGIPLEIPKDSTAGQVFWEKMLQNELQFTASSDEAIDAVNFSAPEEEVVAIAVSTKIRKTDVGYTIAADFEIYPKTGVFTPNSIMIAQGAENIHAAKLFIRFVLGETDGSGEGNDPFITKGAWSTRTDLTDMPERAIEDANFWTLDKEFYAENSAKIIDWWETLRN